MRNRVWILVLIVLAGVLVTAGSASAAPSRGHSECAKIKDKAAKELCKRGDTALTYTRSSSVTLTSTESVTVVAECDPGSVPVNGYWTVDGTEGVGNPAVSYTLGVTGETATGFRVRTGRSSFYSGPDPTVTATVVCLSSEATADLTATRSASVTLTSTESVTVVAECDPGSVPVNGYWTVDGAEGVGNPAVFFNLGVTGEIATGFRVQVRRNASYAGPDPVVTATVVCLTSEATADLTATRSASTTLTNTESVTVVAECDPGSVPVNGYWTVDGTEGVGNPAVFYSLGPTGPTATGFRVHVGRSSMHAGPDPMVTATAVCLRA